MGPRQTSQSTGLLKSAAFELGFAWSGACAAVTPPGYSRLLDWLNAGFAGEMDFIARRREAYRDPGSVMDGAVSLLMLGTNYCTVPPPASVPAGSGRVSRYAWGSGDYHDLIWSRLDQLADRAQSLFPGVHARGVVDTAPLMEREFARLAGLGWQAKNTLLVSPTAGSWFFLSALLLDVELDYDAPLDTNHCGTCTACLDACPTKAFVAPHVLDATRCISYLTIELQNPIPRALREGMGDWVFGCDVCQEVCPWNRFSTSSGVPEFQPGNGGQLPLAGLFFWSEEEFRSHFRKTPLWRPRRRGLLRNAAIVLGNQRDPSALPALERGLGDTESLVRGASAWAMGRIGGRSCREILQQRAATESDCVVRQEIADALESCP